MSTEHAAQGSALGVPLVRKLYVPLVPASEALSKVPVYHASQYSCLCPLHGAHFSPQPHPKCEPTLECKAQSLASDAILLGTLIRTVHPRAAGRRKLALAQAHKHRTERLTLLRVLLKERPPGHPAACKLTMIKEIDGNRKWCALFVRCAP